MERTGSFAKEKKKKGKDEACYSNVKIQEQREIRKERRGARSSLSVLTEVRLG